jgi:excisionase family DNA binding protein
VSKDDRDRLLAGVFEPEPWKPPAPVTKPEPNRPRLLYKTSEARAALDCGQSKFYDLINNGTLDARRFGRRTYITAESLEAFVANLPRAVTPTMAKAEGGDPADTGADRQSPRSRFTSLAPRPPAAE